MFGPLLFPQVKKAPASQFALYLSKIVKNFFSRSVAFFTIIRMLRVATHHGFSVPASCPTPRQSASQTENIVRRRLLIVFLVTLWLSMVAAGTAFVWSHNQTPGVAAEAPVQWPSASIIPRRANEYTLVMLAHPKCPCTRASIEELSKLMAVTQERLTAYVLLLKPHGFAEDWYRTDLGKTQEVFPALASW